MSAVQNKVFAAGSVFTDEKLDDRVATYEDVRGMRFGGDFTTADVAMGDYDYREESADRDQSALKAVEDVARIHVSASTPIGNSRPGTSKMNEYQRAHSMWYQYAQTMSRMDGSTAKLLNELAEAGYKAARETAEKLSAEKNRGVAADKAGFSDRFLVVAQTTDEARIVRAWMNMAMEYVTDGNTLGDNRPLRFKESHLPPVERVAALLEATRPGLVKEIKTIDGKVERPGTNVGVIVAPGAEQAAIDFIRDFGHPVTMGAGRQLWFEAGSQLGTDKNVVINSAGGSRRDSDEYLNERVASQADRVVVFLNGNETDNVVMKAVARAFQRGTLTSAYDKNGNAVSQFVLGENADLLHPTRAVEEHLKEIQRFIDMPAASAEGRLFFSLMPKMSRANIDALSNTNRSVGEILALARTDDGKAALYAEFKLTSEALTAMASGAGVTSAGTALDKIKTDCAEHHVYIVGPEAFPANLARDPSAPAVLYVATHNDPNALGNVNSHVLMAGDNRMPAFMQAPAGELLGQLEKAGAVVSEIEGRGQPRPGQAPQKSILWLSTGHGHADVEYKGIEWNREALPSGTGANSTWHVTKTAARDKDLYQLVETDKAGTSFVHGKRWTTRDEKSVTDAIQGLKSQASLEELTRAQQPAFNYRDSVLSNGGFVVSAQPPRERNMAFRFGVQKVAGYATVSTNESRREIARLATKSADALCVTFTRGEKTSAAMIGTAVENKKGIISVSAPAELAASVAAERQVALYSRTGREIADIFGELSADAKLLLNRDHDRKIISGDTAKGPAAAAERIANRLNQARSIGAAKAVSTGETLEEKVKPAIKKQAERSIA